MSGLGTTVDPRALIPGSPDVVRSTATEWTVAADTFEETVNELGSIDVGSVWTGDAADLFTQRLLEHLTTWATLSRSCRAAASDLTVYEGTLRWAQSRAQQAIDLYTSGATATANAELVHAQAKARAKRELLAGTSAGIVPNFVDPGAAARAEAERILADARHAVLTAGDRAAANLSGTVDIMKLLGAAGSLQYQLAIAPAVDLLRGTVNGVYSFGNALIQNPDKLIELLGGIAALIGGGAGILGGGAVSGTGVGALVGAPAAAGSWVLAGAGAGAIGAALGGLAGEPGVEIWESRGPDRGDGRFHDGTYAGGDKAYVDSKLKEQERLDEMEQELGVPVIRDQIRSDVDGASHYRRYDGLIRNPDGTYTAVEVKTGTARYSPSQREFDGLVTPDNPATATLNGEKIVIVRVIVG